MTGEIAEAVPPSEIQLDLQASRLLRSFLHRHQMLNHTPAQRREVVPAFKQADHTPAAMAFAQQPPEAASAHQSLATSGMTCIDCHRGVAHTLPQGG